MLPQPRTRTLQTLLLGAMLVGATIAACQTDNGDPDQPGVPAQTASATANGVTITLAEATFSGTGTAVTLDVELPHATGEEQVALLPEHITHTGFATTGAVNTLTDGKGLRVFLPPIVPSAGAPPNITVHEVHSAPGPRERHERIAGNWSLDITLPGEDILQELLRVETSPETTVSADGIDIHFHVERTTQATIIHYELPEGVVEITPPSIGIVGEGKEPAPWLPGGTEGSERIASGPPTPMGSDIDISFGPFHVHHEAEGPASVVDIQAAMQRADPEIPGYGAGVGQNTFPIGAEDVIEGDQQLVRSAEVFEETRHYAEAKYTIDLLLHGNWHHETTPIELRSASAGILKMSSVTVQYSQREGRVGPGVTYVNAWFDDLDDLAHLTITIGGASNFREGPWQATVTPR